MKRLSLFLPVLAMILLYSCKPKEEAKMETPPLPASDFNLVTRVFQVEDFDKWKAVYMAGDSLRAASGMSTVTIGRGKDDPNSLLTAHKVTDVDKAKAFYASPETMARIDSAGVKNATAHYIHVIRWDTSAVQGKDRAFVSIKVKDYDTWLKVFDAEGRDMRASNGLVDRGIGRGIDDPNMVYIAFYVTDAAKVTAFMQSPEFAKIKTDSGFEGEPNVFVYTAE